MALTESQIKEKNNKIREEFKDTEEELSKIHEKQMSELPHNYESKLKSTVEAANKSFEKSAQENAISAAGEKYKQYREQKEKERKPEVVYNSDGSVTVSGANNWAEASKAVQTSVKQSQQSYDSYGFENEGFNQNSIQDETQETIADFRESAAAQLDAPFASANNAILFSAVGFVVGILFTFIALKIKKGMKNVEQKKPWFLRPVAWVCTIVMVLAIQFVAELICRLGEYLILWLGGLSTVTIVILVLLFGSAFFGLFFYSAFMLPALLVTVSDKIYPSHHAFRYYLLGLYEIVGCAFLIYAAIIGAVHGGSMFWFYARYGYLIFASIIMMITGRSAANERNVVNQSAVQ